MAASDISLRLDDIGEYLNTQVTPVAQYKRVYKLVSRNGAEKFTNKDLSDNSNIQKFTAYSPFTVSNGVTKASYRSIQAAIDAASATGQREVVLVTPGTYDEDIVLRDNVNIEGFSPAFEIEAHMTVLTGSITHELSDMSEITIARLSYHPTTGHMMIDGTNNLRIIMNGMNIRSEHAGPGILSTNPNLLAIHNNCIISGSDVAYEIIGQVIAYRACVLGDLIPGVMTPRIKINGGVASVIYCNGNIKFEVASGAQLIVGNSFFNGSEPLAALDSAQMIMMNSAYFGSPGDLVTGTGNFIDGGNSLFGATTFPAGINTIPATFEVKSYGEYVPTLAANAGASSLTPVSARWSRSGKTITVSFRFTYVSDTVINPDITLSLPLPTNNFGGTNDALGTCVLQGTTTRPAVISSVTSAQLANVIGEANGAAEVTTVTGSFSYIDPTLGV